MNELVTVIIPTYYDWKRLNLCLGALENQTYPKDKFEVIIINNAPEDSSPELNFSVDFKIIDEEKPGSYAARNAGLKIAKGEIIAFTDSDCIPNKDWIENAVNELADGCDRIAGHIELFYMSEILTMAEIYEKSFAFNQEKYASLGNAATGNMITRKKCFEKVGVFDETLMSGGDMEWGQRCNDQGIGVHYCINVVVNHPARHSMNELINKRKRIMGGVSRSLQLSEAHSIMRGFFPPIKDIIELNNSRHLSFMEKLKAIMVSYYLKIIGNVEYLKVKFIPSSAKR